MMITSISPGYDRIQKRSSFANIQYISLKNEPVFHYNSLTAVPLLQSPCSVSLCENFFFSFALPFNA